jgi:hypothetical protein
MLKTSQIAPCIDYATANPLAFIRNDRGFDPYPERSWHVHEESAPRTLWVDEINR